MAVGDPGGGVLPYESDGGLPENFENTCKR